jgi:hypothetical protein
MDDEEVLEHITTGELSALERYILSYFEGKGLDVMTDSYKKVDKYVGLRYYLCKVELKTEYNERERRYIYPYVEKKDIEKIQEKASELGLDLIDYSIEASSFSEDELILKLYFHPQK